jgi:hypothetical protein
LWWRIRTIIVFNFPCNSLGIKVITTWLLPALSRALLNPNIRLPHIMLRLPRPRRRRSTLFDPDIRLAGDLTIVLPRPSGSTLPRWDSFWFARAVPVPFIDDGAGALALRFTERLALALNHTIAFDDCGARTDVDGGAGSFRSLDEALCGAAVDLDALASAGNDFESRGASVVFDFFDSGRCYAVTLDGAIVLVAAAACAGAAVGGTVVVG